MRVLSLFMQVYPDILLGCCLYRGIDNEDAVDTGVRRIDAVDSVVYRAPAGETDEMLLRGVEDTEGVGLLVVGDKEGGDGGVGSQFEG